jgi:Sec-independent protein secretion pathway component TatC
MSTPDEARPGSRVVVGLVVGASVLLVVAGLRFASYVVAPLFLAFMLAITCVVVLAIGFRMAKYATRSCLLSDRLRVGLQELLHVRNTLP